MSWNYEQVTGYMRSPDGLVVGMGYSGASLGKNNPAAQSMENRGPIPVGAYTIGDPHDTVTHGPFVLPLAPDSGNEMFGRSGFLIHGDSVVAPGTASEGCIIMPKLVREEIARSLDRKLEVISGPYQVDSSDTITV